MRTVSEKTYNMMDGEPQLGKETITTIAVDREEYVEELVKAFLEGANNTSEGFTVRDMYEQEYTVGDDLTQEEIDKIVRAMEKHLIDDDYGTEKAYSLVYTLVDILVNDQWTDEFEIQEMK